jgi:short-subunit dehydrogenase
MARKWLITGASRGIGAAIARAAVAQGDSVALVARSEGVEQVMTGAPVPVDGGLVAALGGG